MSIPQHVSTVKKELEQILSAVVNDGIAIDQNFPFVRQLSNNDWQVSFEGGENISSVMNYETYEQLYKELSQSRIYTAKLVDGGILQLMYSFRSNDLIKHRLAFYPSPTLRPFQEDPESYMQDQLYMEIVSRRLIPFPLRFDFDLETACDVEHPQCHLTLGDTKCCRIPVSAPLTPRWFIEFILRNFYQTENYNFVNNLPPYLFSFTETITNRERELIHVIIPQLI
ncbi:MAG: DUF2290 domain-containing protein [Chloroflexota bacterium]